MCLETEATQGVTETPDQIPLCSCASNCLVWIMGHLGQLPKSFQTNIFSYSGHHFNSPLRAHAYTPPVHHNYLCYDPDKSPFFLSVVSSGSIYRCILWRKVVSQIDCHVLLVRRLFNRALCIFIRRTILPTPPPLLILLDCNFHISCPLLKNFPWKRQFGVQLTNFSLNMIDYMLFHVFC